MGTVIDVTEATFASDVLDRSFSTPVVVDFWASWCGPCRVLGPTLERLASEPEADWVLAKVDVDRNPMLAASAGVQGIPAVRAFKDGRQVAEFVGALPEHQVRAWLAQLGPNEADIEFEAAVERERSGDLEGAAAGYRNVLHLAPAHDEARAALAGVELRLRAGETDTASVIAAADEDPSDVVRARRAADVLARDGRAEEAYDRLIEAIRLNAGEAREEARRHLLSLLDAVPADDPGALAARRKLSLVLF